MSATQVRAESGRAEVLRMFVGGEWVTSRSTRSGPVHNPSTGEVIATAPFCTADEVDAAVRAAAGAFPAWAETPAPDRARILFRYRQLLEDHHDDLARIVSREHGKTFAEARASVQRGIEMIEFACGIPSLLMGEVMANIAPGVDSETVRYPLGVVAGITPFNFPAMVPMWMYPVALVCGNCFVLKPSEKVPLSSMRQSELLAEAGLPAGVFNVVHGDKECVDAILAHPLIKAVSFVGSTPVARYIYTTGTTNGKRVQAAGGAKNHIIVMPDADMDKTIPALQQSAFGCAGERCMAASVALTIGEAGDAVVDRLSDVASRMKVGPTDRDSDAEMGPLITRQHADRVREYIGIGEQEGARVACDGRNLRVPDAPNGFFLGPTVLDRVQPGMRVWKEEIFGPVLSVVRCRTVDEALEIGAHCEFGNGAAIFTRSGRAAREFKHRFNAGMIGINIGVPAPMAWFPFTGWNRSFFGDLHIQGKEAVAFYTQQRMTLTRWFDSSEEQFHDPVWRTGRK